MRSIVALLLLAASLPALAVSVINGGANGANYVVLSTSTDSITATPVNAGTPLPITGTITPNPAAALTPIVCGSAVSSCVLKASAGTFFSAYAECSAACYMMVFNSTTLPGNGATTAGTASGNMVHCIPITAANASGFIDNGAGAPETFSVGMTVAISSTGCATLTASAVGFVHAKVQ